MEKRFAPARRPGDGGRQGPSTPSRQSQPDAAARLLRPGGLAADGWRKTDGRLAAARLSPRASVADDAAVPFTVLIVDDNARFRVRARRWLEADGYAVVAEAASGAAALEAAGRLRPGVVLLDVQLPDMSGIEVAERLTRRPDPPDVVLTSTHDEADFGERLAGCGARGFVPKAELSGDALAALLS